MMKKLLLILCLSPFQHELVEHTIGIAKTALNKGIKVSIFLFMDGVYNIMKTQEGEPFKLVPYSNQFKQLSDTGATIMICKLCKILRGIEEQNIPENIKVEGIAELNELILDSDQVVSFLR